MLMNADSTFLIGATHEVCQDYAVAGDRSPAVFGGGSVSRPQPYVALSDGCSSSPDTDIGARLLVKAAQHLLLDAARLTADRLPSLHEEAARLALAHARLFGLRPQAVDATLLTIHLCEGSALIGCSGDGVIALRSRGGRTDIYSVSYPAGYPLYPSYVHQPARLRCVESNSGRVKEIKHFRSPAAGEPFQLHDSFVSQAQVEVFAAAVSDYELVAVFSDGIHSFFTTEQTETSKRTEAVAPEEVIAALLSFKSTCGAFVKRRVKRFGQDCRRKSRRHMDDLAVGVVWLGG